MPEASKPFRYKGQAEPIGRSAVSKAGQALLNSQAWRRASKAFLAVNPFCVTCKKKGLDVFASQTDHIEPHRGDPEIFWDESNWQPLCGPCGAEKSAKGM